MTEDLLKLIVNTLESRNLPKIKKLFIQLDKKNYFNSVYLSISGAWKTKIEDAFYQTLSHLLKVKKLKNFKELIFFASKLDIFLDPQKIPDRFDILSNLHLYSLQTGQIGEIIELIRFYNEFNLFERQLDKEDQQLIRKLKKDSLFVSNLTDLFERVPDSLIYHVYKIVPQDLFQFFSDYLSSPFMVDESMFAGNYNVSFILNYLDNYMVYGLRVQKIGTTSQFLKFIEREFSDFDNFDHPNNSNSFSESGFIKIKYKSRLHLISPLNIMEIKQKVLDVQNYNFYSLSMVILGGIGPQGHGFTYSTPRGEVVEVCSDIKEHEAIIIKYKQFLKNQFLKELEVEMKNMLISSEIIRDVIDYLSDLLDNEELINYYKRGDLLTKIKQFLKQKDPTLIEAKEKINKLMERISDAISLILRDIRLEDQFKTRMDLVLENKIKSEDIAKLTSLKGKSHYDVLRERFFFQNLVSWFYELYLEEIGKNKKMSKSD